MFVLRTLALMLLFANCFYTDECNLEEDWILAIEKSLLDSQPKEFHLKADGGSRHEEIYELRSLFKTLGLDSNFECKNEFFYIEGQYERNSCIILARYLYFFDTNGNINCYYKTSCGVDKWEHKIVKHNMVAISSYLTRFDKKFAENYFLVSRFNQGKINCRYLYLDDKDLRQLQEYL